jgi:hypothetical protein
MTCSLTELAPSVPEKIACLGPLLSLGEGVAEFQNKILETCAE